MSLQACRWGDWEYAWGCSKNQYRRQPLKHKRAKENFRQTVRKCFSRQVVTTEQVWLFLQQAQAYILANHKIRQEQLTSSSTTDLDSTASPVNVEKLLQRFKTHRCVIGFASSFYKAVFHSHYGENGSDAATCIIFNERHLFVAGAKILVLLVNEFVLYTQMVVQNCCATS
jgi:hypothetical protein